MPICFVSLIDIYLNHGFDSLDELSEEVLDSLYEAREIEISNIMEMQFVLSYMGHISKADSDEMTWFELNNWFKLLRKQKELESKRNIEQ